MTLSAAKNRYLIAPQLSDYDRIGEQWLPYVMRAEGASRSFNSVNTDKWGMRYSVDRNGSPITYDALTKKESGGSIGVVVGSSAVFGVGSSNDRYTIPSYLNRDTDITWLNYGGRAYNSTQELIRLMLHLPKKLDHIIVFSGVNNITLSFRSPHVSPIYNAFFYQSIFERAMSNPMAEQRGLRQALSRLVKEIGLKIFPEANILVQKSIKNQYGEVLACFERDLRALKAISDGAGSRLYFALQPFAVWLDKQFSPEEEEIFEILDSESEEWKELASRLTEVKATYFEDVKRICNMLGIPYFNLNTCLEFNTKEWLFVDRVHLADRGCEISAEILKREFGL